MKFLAISKVAHLPLDLVNFIQDNFEMIRDEQFGVVYGEDFNALPVAAKDGLVVPIPDMPYSYADEIASAIEIEKSGRAARICRSREIAEIFVGGI